VSHILFLQDSGINESLAVATTSALLKRHGHSTRLLLGDEERSPALSVKRLEPDVVVIPCPVGGQRRALADAVLARAAAPQAVVILGGTRATFAPALALRPEVDFVCVGEAEYALLDVADRIDTGRPLDDIRNLAFECHGELVKNPLRPLIEDLDELPMPDRDLYFRYPFVARLPWKKFSSGRGCIHSCSYCWNTSLQEKYSGLGSFVRRKSPERVVQEICAVKQRWPLRLVHFSDDLFTVHSGWLEEFSERYATAVGTPFTCNTSAPLATGASVRFLKAAGCKGVAIGIETGNETLRAEILGKPVPDRVIHRAASHIKGAGLQLYTYNMVGSPRESSDDVLETIRLNRTIATDAVRVNMAVPLKHTDFRETAFSSVLVSIEPNAPEPSNREGVNFESGEAELLKALFRLFVPAVHSDLPLDAVRRLAEIAPASTLSPLRLLGLLEERRITGLKWSEAARFFRHVGDPKRRTANYVSLI
jgi:anaerobic magnesium-protoporphyrin IX monomethyl ester cyclase